MQLVSSVQNSSLRWRTHTRRGWGRVRYLNAFLDARKRVMKQEAAHEDTSRIDAAQWRFLRERNPGCGRRSRGTCTATAPTSAEAELSCRRSPRR